MYVEAEEGAVVAVRSHPFFIALTVAVCPRSLPPPSLPVPFSAVTTSQCPSDHRAHNMWGLSYRLLVDHVTGEAAAAALRASAIRRYMSAIALHPEFPEVASLGLLPLHSRASIDNR